MELESDPFIHHHQHDAQKEAARKRWVFLSFLFPALASMLFGFDIGSTAQGISLIESKFPKAIELESTIISLSLIGAWGATLLAFQIADFLGRRGELLLAGLLYTLGTLIQFVSYFANSLPLLLIGRTVYGLGIGFCMHSAPLYISETASPDVRGKYISGKEVFIVIGMLYGYVAGLCVYHPTQADPTPNDYYHIIYLTALPIEIIVLVGVYILNESPRFMVLKALKTVDFQVEQAQLEESKEALNKLRSDKDEVEKEINDIAEGLASQLGSSYNQLLKAKRPLIIGVGLVVLQQITGQPTVLYFVTKIFASAFTSANSLILPFIGSVVVGAMKLLATLLTAGTVDQRGRRPLLLVGVGVQTVALLIIAAFFEWGGMSDASSNSSGTGELNLEKWASYGILVCIMLYVTGYQIGFGPISWLMISEIYPLKIRSKALSLAVLANFGFNILMAFTYTYITQGLGHSGVFLLYGIIAVGAELFIYFVVPETKGMSLEQIENMFFGDSLRNIQ